MTTELLHKLQLPEDLKHLSRNELETLAADIRKTLLEVGNICGGHLASNLGVVELTIALHAVLESPKDKILWDTSHQTYVHKILTGRLDRIFTVRQENGLSGFAKIGESDHDIFGAGHASTALSAALGVAQARDLRGEDYAVFAVVGDASLSGGMSFEALNNTEKLKSNFVCILNDNDMSISPPVGNMSKYITTLRTSDAYNLAKNKFERICDKIPKIGVPLRKKIEKVIERIRDTLIDVKIGVIFEEFGFRYIGPIDGHNLPMLMGALRYAKNYSGPILVHIITQKGKGHEPAEQDPVKYHGVSPKKAPAAIATAPAVTLPTYTEIFGQEMINIANQRQDTVVITPAMKGGSGLNAYADAFPNRFFDVGIAEEHAVTFAAGLARAGVKPILAIYSTFLQRGYDQLIHDVCLQKLPIVLALDRAGIVGEDGPTHHGVFDYAFLLSIPNIAILAPKDGNELIRMLHWAVDQDITVSVRYPKGPVPVQDGAINTPLTTMKAEILADYSTGADKTHDVLIIGAGSMAWPAAEAADILQGMGISAVALNPRFIKPMDMDTIDYYGQSASNIIVVEEGCAIGGVFSHILSQTRLNKPVSQWHSIAIPDYFLDHGKMNVMREKLGLSKEGIVRKALSLIDRKVLAA